ncbi:hypothetical protein LHYA1_G001328 [Lachnellula hyalina]|uniref:Uncharacterized protein n=1 Tax=Lachnellula hyalina TaxID=1316788 RepID=A0A8H8R7V4_9HELO|nr:uncharacterized protein LHYA1_G001328 [Lachnellula hyalina]TVY29964.1 hypothetical protein LHYA1_G001328 [Lachnellula hyalina]
MSSKSPAHYEAAKRREQTQSAIGRLLTAMPAKSQYKSPQNSTTIDTNPQPIALPKWSAENQSYITANINVLLSNAITARERADANAYIESQRAGTTNTRQGVKRRRDSVANGQQSQKRARGSSKEVLNQSPTNVYDLPKPIQIQYFPLPIKDRDDQWYGALFKRLFTDVIKFVDDYFVLHDLELGDFHQPWALKWNPEFIFWAEQVAEDDPQVGSWDELLRNSSERKWFLVAILVKIIKVKIFDADLWGANQQQKELLLALERSMFQRDGYTRTALRAETCRSIIGARAVTENFYEEVAKLNAQVYLLLEPLTSYLYRLEPSDGKTIPGPANQYQSLHNLISSAAYLSLAVRMSPTIFFWVDVSPGTFYDQDDQTSLDNISYTRSKHAVTSAYTIARSQWVAEKQELDDLVADLEMRGQITTRRGTKAKQRQAAMQTQAPRQPTYEYRAMAKMGVWPSIKRFKPGSAADEERENENPREKIPLYMKNGSREYEISKGAVVCYYGKMGRRQDGRVGLEEFVELKQREWDPTVGMVVGKRPMIATIVGASALGILALAFKYQIAEKTGIHFHFGEAVDFINGVGF